MDISQQVALQPRRMDIGGRDKMPCVDTNRTTFRPLQGFLWGLAWGIAVVVWAWQMAVVPPDRLILFGVVAVTCTAGVFAVMGRPVWRDRRLQASLVGAGLFLVIAVTGIPEAAAGGQVQDGCTVRFEVDGEEWMPQDTAGTRPLVLRDDAVVRWTATVPVQPGASMPVGIRVGGFDVPIWNGSFPLDATDGVWSGEIDLAPYTTSLSDSAGVTLSGTYHLFARAADGSGYCDVHVYVAIKPAHPFDGVIVAALTVAVVGLGGALIVLAVRARRASRNPDL